MRAQEKREMVVTGLPEDRCDDACYALRNDRTDRYHYGGHHYTDRYVALLELCPFVE
jgi:hypothetical protein